MDPIQKFRFPCKLEIYIDIRYNVASNLWVHHKFIFTFILLGVSFLSIEGHKNTLNRFLYVLLPKIINIIISNAESLPDCLWKMDFKLVCSTPIL